MGHVLGWFHQTGYPWWLVKNGVIYGAPIFSWLAAVKLKDREVGIMPTKSHRNEEGSFRHPTETKAMKKVDGFWVPGSQISASFLRFSDTFSRDDFKTFPKTNFGGAGSTRVFKIWFIIH